MKFDTQPEAVFSFQQRSNEYMGMIYNSSDLCPSIWLSIYIESCLMFIIEIGYLYYAYNKTLFPFSELCKLYLIKTCYSCVLRNYIYNFECFSGLLMPLFQTTDCLNYFDILFRNRKFFNSTKTESQRFQEKQFFLCPQYVLGHFRLASYEEF